MTQYKKSYPWEKKPAGTNDDIRSAIKLLSIGTRRWLNRHDAAQYLGITTKLFDHGIRNSLVERQIPGAGKAVFDKLEIDFVVSECRERTGRDD